MSESDDPKDRAAFAFEEVFAKYRVLDGFRALHESAIWALNNNYWRHAGPAAFTRDAVPYHATSDGGLSVATADLLVTFARRKAQVRSASSQLALVELGPGTGLFGRITAQRYVRAQNKDPTLPTLYYLGIDCARSMVDAIEARGLLNLKGVETDFAVLDIATQLDQLEAIIRERITEGTPIVVVANYFLDSLPSTVFRRERGEIREISVEVRAGNLASSRLDDAQLLLRLQTQPCGPNDRFADLARPFLKKEGDQLAINRGALLFIEAIVKVIGTEGIILVNDYHGDVYNGSVAWQHFAGQIATGVHFPTLEEFATVTLGWSVFEPEAQTTSMIGRLLAADCEEAVVAAYRRLFSYPDVRQAQAMVAAARDAREQGRAGEAAARYETAVLLQPENWSVATEAAGFLLNVMSERGAAAELARLAVDSNPLCAPAWNILGDCAYRAGDVAGAATAYQVAQNVPGGDTRALINLAYCACTNGDMDEALALMARALAVDANGPLTSEILSRQAEIISRLPETAQRKPESNP
jgi:Flp pilus assembly protein TadD